MLDKSSPIQILFKVAWICKAYIVGQILKDFYGGVGGSIMSLPSHHQFAQCLFLASEHFSSCSF